MSRGVLIFAFNTVDINYVKMAEYTATRINHFLNLPVTLVTDTNLTSVHNIFDKVINIEPNYTNLKKGKVWINKDRYKAFELSPYNSTILLDVDYIVNSQKLNKLFDIVEDICAHNTTNFAFLLKNEQELLSNISYQTFWATVVCFKKTKKAKQVFDCMKMIQENYGHYANIYQFMPSPYRNDYALSVALHIVNGHILPISEIIPWNLFHVDDKVSIYKIISSNLCNEFLLMKDNINFGRLKKEYIIIKDLDFHLLNKDSMLELIHE